MLSRIKIWLSEKWNTKIGKAGFLVSAIAIAKQAWVCFLWLVDLPGRLHQVGEWIDEVPSIHLNWYPWVNPVIFIVGVALLLWDSKKTPVRALESDSPDISAEFLRMNFRPRNPFNDMTAEVYRAMNRTMPPTEHDLLTEIYLVNLSECPTTIRKIEAEAEVDGVWITLSEADPDMYIIAFEKKQFSGGFRTVSIENKNLPSLLEKIKDVELRKSIGYQGWVAFELLSETKKLESASVNFRVFVVDAMEGRHQVVKSKPLLTSGRIMSNPDRMSE